MNGQHIHQNKTSVFVQQQQQQKKNGKSVWINHQTCTITLLSIAHQWVYIVDYKVDEKNEKKETDQTTWISINGRLSFMIFFFKE